jgi:hypothetical protein
MLMSRSTTSYLRMDLDDGQSARVSTWADLGLAEEEQRRQIVDVLRKYTD